ncbi:MAG: hypothetical protein ABI693_12670 [Bryobacteraceae bacterium]
MVLSSQEESLISIVRALPPEEAGKVLGWARQLTDLSQGRPIQWSDSWSGEDTEDVTRAAFGQFDCDEFDDQ